MCIRDRRKNGRLSKVKAFVATALRIKPVMVSTPEGEIAQLDQARGMNKALVRMVDSIVEKVSNPEQTLIAISHCNCPERAQMVKETLINRLHPKGVLVPVSYTHLDVYKRQAGDMECAHYEEMYRNYREYFSETCMYKVVPYPGIPELLEKLKEAGIRITVLSNKPHAQAVDVVETLFGKGYFDAVQGQTDSVPRKPSPIGANRLAELFQAEKKAVSYTHLTDGKKRVSESPGVPGGLFKNFRGRADVYTVR